MPAALTNCVTSFKACWCTWSWSDCQSPTAFAASPDESGPAFQRPYGTQTGRPFRFRTLAYVTSVLDVPRQLHDDGSVGELSGCTVTPYFGLFCPQVIEPQRLFHDFSLTP